VIVVDEVDAVAVVRRSLAGLAGSFGVQHEHSSGTIQLSALDPEVHHHGCDNRIHDSPGPGVVAEGQDGLYRPALGHEALTLADGPETAERTSGFDLLTVG
jgi:hypothetical protein